ncbi:MAG: replication initiation factor domain-containing protein [Oscillospiraceae bacterium]|nr:replication initiation factor domain-containing protein [Oscillospiraceae bacterium]
MVGMNRTYLADLERGAYKLSAKLSKRLESVFALFEHNNPIDVMYDYVRVRFPFSVPGTDELSIVQANAKEIIEGVFGLRFESWIDESKKRYGYAGIYTLGDLHVMYPRSEAANMGILLELKGYGCRQLEFYMEKQGRTWHSFFRACYNYVPDFKRLDIAINDHVGILSVPDLIERCEQDAFDLMPVRTYRALKSRAPIYGETVDKKPAMACTLYLGFPRKSKIYFCLYEKDHERKAKARLNLVDAGPKNCFEIRLSEECANFAVQEIIEKGSVETVALNIIEQDVIFWASPDQPDKTYPRWTQFIGVGRHKAKLALCPKPFTLERKLQWIGKYAIPTLKMLAVLDQFHGTSKLDDMYAQAELSDHQKRLHDQMTKPVDEILVPAFLNKQTHPPAYEKGDEDGFVETNMKPGEVLTMNRKFTDINK